jgi:hypothetical protein
MWCLAFRQRDTNISEKAVPSVAQRTAAAIILKTGPFSAAGNHWSAHIVYTAEEYGNWLNITPRLEEWLHLLLTSLLEDGHYHGPTDFPRNRKPQYSLGKWLVGPQSRSGGFETEKYLTHCASNHDFSVVQSAAEWLNRLSYPGSAFYMNDCKKLAELFVSSSFEPMKLLAWCHVARSDTSHFFKPHILLECRPHPAQNLMSH